MEQILSHDPQREAALWTPDFTGDSHLNHSLQNCKRHFLYIFKLFLLFKLPSLWDFVMEVKTVIRDMTILRCGIIPYSPRPR